MCTLDEREVPSHGKTREEAEKTAAKLLEARKRAGSRTGSKTSRGRSDRANAREPLPRSAPSPRAGEATGRAGEREGDIQYGKMIHLLVDNAKLSKRARATTGRTQGTKRHERLARREHGGT